MVSKRATLNDLHAAAVADKLTDLKIASQRLESIISDIRYYRSIVGLDISYGSMAPRTTEGVFKTLSNGLHYLVHHFHYTDQMTLLNLEKIKTLSTVR